MFRVAKLHPQAIVPKMAKAGDAGLDLASVERIDIPARGRALVDIGISLEIPLGYYGRVAPRSGLAVKHGICVGAGVIDSSYRGVIKVLLFNHSDTAFTVVPGDRIAQIIFEQIAPAVDLVEIQPYELSATDRGYGGFGSTGTTTTTTS